MKRLLEVGSAEDLKRRKTPKLHQYWDSLGTQDLTIMLLRVLEEILKAPTSLSERTAQQRLLCRLGAPTIVLKFASCEVDAPLDCLLIATDSTMIETDSH